MEPFVMAHGAKAFAPWVRLRCRYVVLAEDDLDTDQIIPARFLTTTRRDGLGPHLFADRRRDAAGRPRPDFPLERSAAAATQVLVAGANFGCGSSREHAVWALAGAGFRAVVARSFADIFRHNALQNGLLPVALPETAWRALRDHESDAGAEAVVEIDLEAQSVTLPGGRRVGFAIDPFARLRLLQGLDELDFLLREEAAVRAYEEGRRWTP